MNEQEMMQLCLARAAQIVATYRSKAPAGCDPQNTGVATAIAAVGVAVAAASAGYAMSGAGNPKQPDLASSSAKLSNINAQMLPYRRMLEAAAQQGTSVTLPGVYNYQQKDKNGNWKNISQQQYQEMSSVNIAALVAGGGQKPVLRRVPLTVDFRGYGATEVQAKIAQQMAELQKNLSAKYDSQFIDQALEQEKLADPQSFAARQKMDDLIQKQITNEPDRPVATELDKQIGSQLTAARAGHLDPAMKQALDSSVSSALSDRGGGAAGADFEQPLVTGAAGEQRKRDAAQKAISWLTSGATPEDVQYRREQQNLSNLSSQVNGRTPQSQFASLSGAQSGPTPFSPGQPLSTMPQNQNQGAMDAAIGGWGTQMRSAGAQASPWTAAVSGTANIAQLLGAAGYKPLASVGTGPS